jgi:eukaryotic-like serine/threonine-protein kinase
VNGGISWSRDGRSVAFSTDGGLKRINLAGGGAQSLAPRTPAEYAGSWSNDDTILFSAPAPPAAVAIGRVPAAGGSVTRLTAPNPERSEDGHVVPRWLPDGEHFIYLGGRASGLGGTVYLGSVSGGEPRPLFRIDESQELGRRNRTLNLAYANGFILHFRDEALMAQPFNVDSLALRGEPLTLLENVGEFSVAENLLVYREAADTQERRRRLTWVDRAGRPVGQVETPPSFRFPVLSPDARQIAVAAPGPDSPWDDIWTIDVERGLARRLTFDQAADIAAVWSPDSERIAFSSARNAAGDVASTIYVRGVSSAEAEQQLFGTSSTVFAVTHDWSRDGRYILFHRLEGDGSAFWVLPLSGDESPRSLLEFSFEIGPGRLSPDGRWIAYAADESDGFQIIVQPFPNVGDGKWQVSVRGGFNPRWRDDGRELYYLARDGSIMAVDVEESGGRFEAGEPHALFATKLRFPTTRSTFDHFFDVAPGGERFLVIEESSDLPEPDSNPSARATETLNVIVNWTSRLRE